MTDHLARAARAWLILTKVAHQRGRIEYADLARLIGIHVRPLRYVLGVIQDYCMTEGLPPLTILVVNRAGRQGQGFIAWDPDDAETGFREVWRHSWGTDNPFGVSDGVSTEDDLMAMLRTDSAEEVWRLVTSRGVRQILFRRAVTDAYSGRCAISGCSICEGLEAAHIVPWASCKRSDRLSPRNGLLLTSFHHRLFDRGILTIDDGYRIRVLRDRPKTVMPSDKALLWDLDGSRLTLPRNRKLWPDVNLIAQRNHALGFIQNVSPATEARSSEG